MGFKIPSGAGAHSAYAYPAALTPAGAPGAAAGAGFVRGSVEEETAPFIKANAVLDQVARVLELVWKAQTLKPDEQESKRTSILELIAAMPPRVQEAIKRIVCAWTGRSDEVDFATCDYSTICAAMMIAGEFEIDTMSDEDLNSAVLQMIEKCKTHAPFLAASHGILPSDCDTDFATRLATDTVSAAISEFWATVAREGASAGACNTLKEVLRAVADVGPKETDLIKAAWQEYFRTMDREGASEEADKRLKEALRRAIPVAAAPVAAVLESPERTEEARKFYRKFMEGSTPHSAATSVDAMRRGAVEADADILVLERLVHQLSSADIPLEDFMRCYDETQTQFHAIILRAYDRNVKLTLPQARALEAAKAKVDWVSYNTTLLAIDTELKIRYATPMSHVPPFIKNLAVDRFITYVDGLETAEMEWTPGVEGELMGKMRTLPEPLRSSINVLFAEARAKMAREGAAGASDRHLPAFKQALTTALKEQPKYEPQVVDFVELVRAAAQDNLRAVSKDRRLNDNLRILGRYPRTEELVGVTQQIFLDPRFVNALGIKAMMTYACALWNKASKPITPEEMAALKKSVKKELMARHQKNEWNSTLFSIIWELSGRPEGECTQAGCEHVEFVTFTIVDRDETEIDRHRNYGAIHQVTDLRITAMALYLTGLIESGEMNRDLLPEAVKPFIADLEAHRDGEVAKVATMATRD